MLKIGVIGCGAIGRDHIRRLHDLVPGAEVVGCADYFQEAADKVAAQYGIRAYASGEELIASPDVQAILIEKNKPDLACGAVGSGEITSIPTAPAVQGAYYRLDGKFRTSLPLEDTPYTPK